MKRFFYCFTLFLFFVINLSFANSQKLNNILRRVENTPPEQLITMLFNVGAQDKDFRNKTEITSISNLIHASYKKDKSLQLEAIDIWQNYMQEQNKYTDEEIEYIITTSYDILGLK